MLGIIRLGIGIQHVLHIGDEGGIRLRWDYPLLLQPRLEVVFLSVRHTVAASIDSTTSISTSLPASNFIVQRACPSGAGEQAKAISCASCLPSSLRYCRPVGFLRCSVASSPSAANCCRTRMTVMR